MGNISKLSFSMSVQSDHVRYKNHVTVIFLVHPKTQTFFQMYNERISARVLQTFFKTLLKI